MVYDGATEVSVPSFATCIASVANSISSVVSAVQLWFTNAMYCRPLLVKYWKATAPYTRLLKCCRHRSASVGLGVLSSAFDMTNPHIGIRTSLAAVCMSSRL